jgi:hypothetical protein
MEAVTESAIRKAFVNQTGGEAKRAFIPDLAAQPWEDLDYLGWRDPKAPQRAYLVADVDGATRAIGLRLSSGSAVRRTMCSLCMTFGDAALMVAPRAGKAGQAGNTVGTWICADLACSLYVRGKRKAPAAPAYETLSNEQKAARLRANLADFVARVLA